MFDLERWQELLETLWKNRLRTFLTGLSVSSGIFILVILLGFGKGLENGIEAEFAAEGSTTALWVWPETTTVAYDGLNPGRDIELSLDDYYEMEEAFDSLFEHGSPRMFVRGVNAMYKDDVLAYGIQAVNEDFQFVENEEVAEGRYINLMDIENRSKVIVIGGLVAREVFKDVETPVGEHIELSGIPFKVVGVFSKTRERSEQRMMIPITTAEAVFSDSNRVSNYGFSLPRKSTLEENLKYAQYVKGAMLRFMQRKYRISPEDEAAIYIWSPVEESIRYYTLAENMAYFFWFVGLCTIIAGIVGVGNIMLIVVKERTRELGIRKALGATPFSLIGLVLHEALFITIVSGCAGLITSMGLLEIFGPRMDIEYIENPAVDFRIALSTVIVLVVAGTLAGMVPAVKAAHTEVIHALKEE